MSAGRRERRFAAPGGWSVRVVSIQVPGDSQARQYFQVRHAGYLIRETRDVVYVRRVMGDELFAQLAEVTLHAQESPS
jgi:hypothetical protein